MGKFSLKKKACVLMSWALMLTCSAAEQEYFPQSGNLTWDDARSRCQVCFKDLVTLTPENIQTIALKITSDSWVGLRKSFYSSYNSRSNPHKSWSRWANGDPLAFQNWYPGWPVFKSSFPKRDCCSCSCTCPAPTTTTTTQRMQSPDTRFTASNVMDFTGPENETVMSSFTDGTDQNVTSFSEWSNTPGYTPSAPSLLPLEAECVRSPMLLTVVPDPDENYIEDSCVAMLSFGAWVEKNCTEPLPFICYEDRFFGQVNVTNVTSGSASLKWLPGPGNISHYRLEVKGDEDKELKENLMYTTFTYSLSNLTAGSYYSVQVFPVKCDRDLNPQAVAFFTIPNKVENLTVSAVANTSITLSWDQPAGNVDFYLIKVQGQEFRSDTLGKVLSGLIPGNPYTFTVLSVVKDNSTWSEESNITAYTKPATVSDLQVSKNTNNSLFLSWVLPEGNATGYRLKVNGSFREVVNQPEVRVTGLPVGSKITLSVTALANLTLEGDKVTVVSYTAPGPISNLALFATSDSLNATWSPPEGNFSDFTVMLKYENETTAYNLTESMKIFSDVKTGANYTVIVYSNQQHLRGPPVETSNFTLPKPPTNPKVDKSQKNELTFTWTAPSNTATVTYSVKLNSSFWNYNFSESVNTTKHTFADLKSGTRYDFEVRTVAGGRSSLPEKLSGTYTVAEKREISLSMSCSSTQSLLCDDNTSRTDLFNKLKARFSAALNGSVFWELKMQDSEN